MTKNTPAKQTARRAYEARQRCTHRRVYGRVPLTQYTAVQTVATLNGRTVWQQIWQESCAYRSQVYLPSVAVEQELASLSVQIRRIGNHLNQMAHHSNRFQKFLHQQQVLTQLQLLDNAVQEAVKNLSQSR